MRVCCSQITKDRFSHAKAHIILSNMGTIMPLIRLRGCAGWMHLYCLQATKNQVFITTMPIINLLLYCSLFSCMILFITMNLQAALKTMWILISLLEARSHVSTLFSKEFISGVSRRKAKKSIVTLHKSSNF